MDVNQILLIAQVGTEVIGLGKVALADLMDFLHSTGSDKAKIAQLRVLYAAAIAAEEAELADPTPAPSAP